MPSLVGVVSGLIINGKISCVRGMLLGDIV